jgi:hypothetical protein
MKPGLKRIEATLDQLGVQPSAIGGNAIDCAPGIDPSSSGSRNATFPSRSAKVKAKPAIEPFPLPKDSIDSPAAPVSAGATSENHPNHIQKPSEPALSNPSPNASTTPPIATALPLPAPSQGATMPDLSSNPSSVLSSHRYAANPNLAIGLLKEVETLVRGWQAELDQIAQQIQAIYEDGPIVDGWLESYSSDAPLPAQSSGASLLRYAEVEHLMALVEQICQPEPNSTSDDMRRTSYRLCGLDPDGNMWSRSCPSEQVPYVSLAIARYQKLRTLFAKKQSLENRLTNLVESLTMLHGQIVKG